MLIDSLPSELFSHLLSFLEGIDRLSLRLCSHALEEAVAASDLHARPNGYNVREIAVREWYGALRVQVGEGLKVSVPLNDWDRALRMRKRLFNRAYANKFCISALNFNEVPMAAMLQLTDGFIVDTVHLSAITAEYGENFVQLIRHFDRARLVLHIYDRMLDRNTLLSLKPQTELQIVGDVSWRVDDEFLLVLARKEFRMLRIPVDLRNEDTIFEVIKIVSDSDTPQCVVLKIPDATMDRFLALIGIMKEGRIFSKNRGSEFHLNLAKQYPYDHTLIYENATVKTQYREEEDVILVSLVIANSQYSSL